ncbi:hypothetical protein GS482_30270, partial [Rhodococcus hoagii]|nr:hypothetical protein [Prescottella equi]
MTTMKAGVAAQMEEAMTSKKKNYDEAADWAEHEMTLPENSKTARRGAAAAEAGRALLARAHAGRPSLDPQGQAGGGIAPATGAAISRSERAGGRVGGR